MVRYKNQNHLEMNKKIIRLLEKESFVISPDGICPDQTRTNHLEKVKEYSEFFEYVNKHKNNVRYDPKDFTGLRDYYKKEHERINKMNSRADEMLNYILSNG